MTTFGVITDVSKRYGNMASAAGQVFVKTKDGNADNSWVDEYEYVSFTEAMELYTQVFWKGEILVLDESGREIGGVGRKPSKWFVTCEHFNNIEDAIRRSREVTRDDD